MNRYDKCYNKTEEISYKKENLRLNHMILKVKRELIKYFDKESAQIIYKANSRTIFTTVIINLSLYNKKLQEYIIKNVINRLSKESIINYYLIYLCNSQTKKDYTLINTIINSMKISGLVNDIIFDNEKNKFILITTDNKEIIFSCRNDTKEQINKANGHCHGVTYHILKNNQNNNLYAATILIDNLYGEKYYHSFIINNNIVNDYAHNIIINFDDYKELYKPDIIFYADAKKVCKGIDKLKNKDKEFSDHNCELLNYAIDKQLRKEQKRLIRK